MHKQVSKDGIPFTYHEFEVVLLSENKQQFSQHLVSVIFPLGFKESNKLSKEVTWEHLSTHGQHPKEATKVRIVVFFGFSLHFGRASATQLTRGLSQL